MELLSQSFLAVPPKVCMNTLLSAGGIKSHSLSINSHSQLVPLTIVGLIGQGHRGVRPRVQDQMARRKLQAEEELPAA